MRAWLAAAVWLVVLPAFSPLALSAEPMTPRLRWMERVELGEGVLGDTAPSEARVLASLDLDARGWPADLLRDAARSRAALLPFSDFHQVHGLLALTRQSFSVPGEATRPVAWHGEGRYLGLLAPVGEAVVVHAPFWLPEEWVGVLRRPGSAANPVRPLELRQVITFVLPLGMPRLTLPEPAKGKSGPLEWSLVWSLEGPSRRYVEVRLEAVLASGREGPEDFEALREELLRLYGAMVRGARFVSSTARAHGG